MVEEAVRDMVVTLVRTYKGCSSFFILNEGIAIVCSVGLGEEFRSIKFDASLIKDSQLLQELYEQSP